MLSMIPFNWGACVYAVLCTSQSDSLSEGGSHMLTPSIELLSVQHSLFGVS